MDYIEKNPVIWSGIIIGVNEIKIDESIYFKTKKEAIDWIEIAIKTTPYTVTETHVRGYGEARLNQTISKMEKRIESLCMQLDRLKNIKKKDIT